jgi:hypothetical protein
VACISPRRLGAAASADSHRSSDLRIQMLDYSCPHLQSRWKVCGQAAGPLNTLGGSHASSYIGVIIKSSPYPGAGGTA